MYLQFFEDIVGVLEILTLRFLAFSFGCAIGVLSVL